MGLYKLINFIILENQLIFTIFLSKFLRGLVGSMCRDLLIDSPNPELNPEPRFLYGGRAPADDFAAKNAGCSLRAASAYAARLMGNGPSRKSTDMAIIGICVFF